MENGKKRNRKYEIRELNSTKTLTYTKIQNLKPKNFLCFKNFLDLRLRQWKENVIIAIKRQILRVFVAPSRSAPNTSTIFIIVFIVSLATPGNGKWGCSKAGGCFFS